MALQPHIFFLFKAGVFEKGHSVGPGGILARHEADVQGEAFFEGDDVEQAGVGAPFGVVAEEVKADALT